MQHAHPSPVSPAAQSRLPKSPEKSLASKQNWAILGHLVEAKRYLPLKTAEVSTLRALLSCRQDAGTIVYAGNRTLAKRADGVDERTLTRHLSRLCKMGFLSRKSSANGKRYVKTRPQGAKEAFGVDLAPLFERATEFALLARRAKEEDLLIAQLRDCLSQLRFTLADHDLAPALVRKLGLQRRRKADLAAMRYLEAEARAVLAEACIEVSIASPGDLPKSGAEDLTVNDRQYVGHNETPLYRESSGRALGGQSDKSDEDFESGLKIGASQAEPQGSKVEPQQPSLSKEDLCRYADDILAGFRAKLAGQSASRTEEPATTALATGKGKTEAPMEDMQTPGSVDGSAGCPSPALNTPGGSPAHDLVAAARSGASRKRQACSPSIAQILDACPTARTLESETPSTWSELITYAWRIGGWLGLTAELMAEACAAMGRQGLALALLGLCERQATLRQPAAYLRSIMRRPGFRPESLLGFGT